MFTGIITDVGTVKRVERTSDTSVVQLEVVVGHSVPEDLKGGDSVAVNGCCLTVTQFDRETLCFDVSEETRRVTNLGGIGVGSRVNLEYALRVGDRLGGHWVLGHVDDVATVTQYVAGSGGVLLEVKVNGSLARHVVAKGSICLDGVSLTVNSLQDEPEFTLVQVNLIPTTLAKTHFEDLQPGDMLNLEVDVLSKFVNRQQLFHSD